MSSRGPFQPDCPMITLHAHLPARTVTRPPARLFTHVPTPSAGRTWLPSLTPAELGSWGGGVALLPTPSARLPASPRALLYPHVGSFKGPRVQIPDILEPRKSMEVMCLKSLGTKGPSPFTPHYHGPAMSPSPP